MQIVQKPQRRGAEIFAFQLCRALHRLGHETCTAYLYPHQGAHPLPTGEKDYLLNGRPNHPFEKIPGVNYFLLRQLLQAVATFRPDIIQLNGARTVKYGAFARYASPHSPWVLVYRNIGQPQDWLGGWHYRMFYDKIVMPQLDGVVGVSQKTLQSVQDFYALPIPVQHIPRAVDPANLLPTLPASEIREVAQTPATAPVLISVGSLTAEKRVDRLLHLLKALRHRIPGLCLWLVGTGPLGPELKKQASALGIREAVRFLGVQDCVANYLGAADLFVLGSDTEGIPGAILEAGWLGLPVVATRVGGVPECVVEGETGLLVDRDDARQFADAVFSLLHDRERRQSMGEKAKDRMRQYFTIDRAAGAYVDFYRRVQALRMGASAANE